MRAVVLVGGEGTRLRPLTLTRPKPMLPVVHRPMLEHKLSHLAAHGVTDVVLSLGYKPDAFLAAFPTHEACGVRLAYAVEPTPLDTAGAIRFAATSAGYLDGPDPIVAVNGDVLTEIDLDALLELHRARGAEATIALTRVDDPSVFGVVPIDSDGRVEAFIEKPKREEAPTDWINAGVYVFQPSVFDRIPPDTRVSMERQTFPALVADRTLFALQDPAYWLDAGTPATLLQANLDALRSGAQAIDPTADVRGTVVDSVIEASAVVEQDATVVRSVVMRGARIGRGCVVEDSLIGANAEVSDASRLVGFSVVGDGTVVAAGSYDGAKIPG